MHDHAKENKYEKEDLDFTHHLKFKNVVWLYMLKFLHKINVFQLWFNLIIIIHNIFPPNEYKI